MEKFDIKKDILQLKNTCFDHRHHLHKIPEASGKEYETSRYLKECMAGLGYQVTEYEECTGFIADLIVDPSFKTIAWRADIDALEMEDKTENEYKSTHEGLAHNCGHDTHMAISLTAAEYLAANTRVMKHNARFIFQMAEEDMRVPGACLMVELGAMDGVDEVYALHNTAALPYGTVQIKEGVLSSYGHAWTLNVKGVSTHGSTPHLGLDAIRETARLIEHMDYIVAKKTSPFSPAVFGCGMIHGGTVPNAVCDFVEARGTIRSMDAETNQVLIQSFDEVVAISKAAGFDTTLEYTGYPAVENHREAVNTLVSIFNKFIPEEMIETNCTPMTGSEDFSLFINAIPNKTGAMFFLGMGNPEEGIINYLHANPYYVEDRGMLVGVQIVADLFI